MNFYHFYDNPLPLGYVYPGSCVSLGMVESNKGRYEKKLLCSSNLEFQGEEPIREGKSHIAGHIRISSFAEN